MSVFIIAEAGVNHNGSIKIAKKLINLASEAGADAIKFQTFKAENIATINSKKANYQKHTTSKKESQYKMLKKLELTKEAHQELIRHSKKKKIQFLSSPFDHESIQLLDDLGLKIFKIPSGEITNFPYLKHLGKLKKKIILSTGMANILEIRKALNILTNSGTKKSNITILHTNTEYPTPMKDVNLNAMITIRNLFKVAVGYSDHTLGVEVDIAAVALGAKCIEKHFTLNRNMRGPDHKASLEPKEFKYMIRSIRNIEIALGDGTKKPTKSEKKNIKIVRKSIVAKIEIKKGDRFSKNNIAIKRPGIGMSPMKWEKILGTKAKKNYNTDDLI